MFLSRVHAVKKKEEKDRKEKGKDQKNQFKLAKLMYQDMKDIHAKKVKVAKIEMNFKVKLMKKAIAKNEPVNKNSIFVQDRSKRTKFEQ